jgi:hypothetical protein
MHPVGVSYPWEVGVFAIERVIYLFSPCSSPMYHLFKVSPVDLYLLFPQIDFDSVYAMNKDLFKVPKANNRGSQGPQEPSVVSLPQKNAKSGRPMGNRFGGHDRRTVITPMKNKVHVL